MKKKVVFGPTGILEIQALPSSKGPKFTGYKIDWKQTRKNFDGSDALFRSCKMTYLGFLDGAIDDPTCQDDVDGWMNEIASEKVNNPKSRFWMHG